MLKKRIQNGIKFFRVYVKDKRYDSKVFKQYWPKFLDMVEAYINEDNFEENIKKFFDE